MRSQTREAGGQRKAWGAVRLCEQTPGSMIERQMEPAKRVASVKPGVQ
jgi:hypothetical protein